MIVERKYYCLSVQQRFYSCKDIYRRSAKTSRPVATDLSGHRALALADPLAFCFGPFSSPKNAETRIQNHP